MVDKKRGPFGRTGDGRVLPCQCSGCCGREWNEFPDTIEGRIYTDAGTAAFSYKVTMYKDRKNSVTCTCGQKVGVISYSSQSIKILTDSWPDLSNENCCVSFGIQGNCSDGVSTSIPLQPGASGFPPYPEPLPFGECYWVLSVRWTGGDPLFYAWDITPSEYNENPVVLSSCNPIAFDGGAGGTLFAPACILGLSGGLGGVSFEVKEDGITAPSEPSEPCKFLCCAIDDSALWANLTSSCPELNGQSIELTYGNNSWTGEIVIGTCEKLTITVLQHERYSEDETCPLTVMVSSTQGGVCFTENQNLGSAPACPPWSASGTLPESCGCICGGHTLSIEITE